MAGAAVGVGELDAHAHADGRRGRIRKIGSLHLFQLLAHLGLTLEQEGLRVLGGMILEILAQVAVTARHGDVLAGLGQFDFDQPLELRAPLQQAAPGGQARRRLVRGTRAVGCAAPLGQGGVELDHPAHQGPLRHRIPCIRGL